MTAYVHLEPTTIQDIAKAEKDGGSGTTGATQGYRHADGRRVVLHIHPKATKSPRILKGLLDCIGWTEADMRKLRLIK